MAQAASAPGTPCGLDRKARVPAQGIQGNEQLPGPFALSQPGGTQRHAIEEGVPMSRTPMFRIVPQFLVAATASFPLLAQNATPIDEKQCREQFRAADLDYDGVLTASEIGFSSRICRPHLPIKTR